MNFPTKKAGKLLVVFGLIGLMVYWLTGLVPPNIKQTYFPSLLVGEQIEFNRDIRPILNKNCIACHGGVKQSGRSEEHTSELQSRENLVCRLLLEKKNKPTDGITRIW